MSTERKRSSEDKWTSTQKGKKLRDSEGITLRSHESSCKLLQLPNELKAEIFSYLTHGQLLWDVGFTCRSLFDYVYGNPAVIEVYQDGMHRDARCVDRMWGVRKPQPSFVHGRMAWKIKMSKREVKFADDFYQVMRWKEIVDAVKCLIICPFDMKEEIYAKMLQNEEMTGKPLRGISLMVLRDRNTSMDVWQKNEVYWLEEVMNTVNEKCQNLESVYINGCRLSPNSLQLFRSDISLLDLAGCRKVTSCLKQITMNCLQLTYLDLSNCNRLSNSDLGFIAENCRLLEALNLNQCCKTTCDGVVPVALNCIHLKELYIWNVEMTRRCHCFLHNIRCDTSNGRLNIYGKVFFIPECMDH